MREAAGAAKGGVAFVNLEPRFGVHPVHGAVDGAEEEVQALLSSGVERVVVGLSHPVPGTSTPPRKAEGAPHGGGYSLTSLLHTLTTHALSHTCTHAHTTDSPRCLSSWAQVCAALGWRRCGPLGCTWTSWIMALG